MHATDHAASLAAAADDLGFGDGDFGFVTVPRPVGYLTSTHACPRQLDAHVGGLLAAGWDLFGPPRSSPLQGNVVEYAQTLVRYATDAAPAATPEDFDGSD